MAYGIHTFTKSLLYIYNGLTGKSRTDSGGDTNATTFVTASGTTTWLASEVMDLTNFSGSIHARVSAGTIGTSLDGKWVESDDLVTWTAVATLAGANAITQLTAAGENTCEINVRRFTKRYAKFVTTQVGTCVYSVYIFSWKRKEPTTA